MKGTKCNFGSKRANKSEMFITFDKQKVLQQWQRHATKQSPLQETF